MTTPFDRVVTALQAARDDGSGVVLVALHPDDVARLLGWLAARGSERSRWTPGARFQHLLQLTDRRPQ